MKSLDALQKRTAELIDEKAKRIEAANKDIEATASKAAEIEARARKAHAARNYEEEIELQAQADKVRKVQAEYKNEVENIKNGVLIDPDEYETKAAEVIKELEALTATNQKKICKLLAELQNIKKTECETLDEANKALRVWQYDVNGRRDLIINKNGRTDPRTELRYKDYSNVIYLTYILETMDATADYMKRYENK